MSLKSKQSKIYIAHLDKNKLPLYGPLDIRNYKTFLEESKKAFYARHANIYHSDISIDDFDIVTTLGRGAFGTVKLVREKATDTYYAAKLQLKQRIMEDDSAKRVFFEKRVLFSIDFPFCVRMEHYCHDKEAVYFLMPFFRGGELYQLIKKLGYFHQNMVRFYAAQVVLALEYFQHIHFVYRDLKPENILLDHTGFLKITDFGLTKQVESRTYTICGTPAYMAPEVIEGSGYARSVDWWSLGVLIFEMTVGRPPFVAKDSVRMFTKIMYAPVPMYPVFSDHLKSLLRGLLNKDVTRRLGNLKDGAEDIKKHPWFKKVDWLQLLNRRVKPPYIPETSGPADTRHFPYVARLAAREAAAKAAAGSKQKESNDDEEESVRKEIRQLKENEKEKEKKEKDQSKKKQNGRKKSKKSKISFDSTISQY